MNPETFKEVEGEFRSSIEHVRDKEKYKKNMFSSLTKTKSYRKDGSKIITKKSVILNDTKEVETIFLPLKALTQDRRKSSSPTRRQAYINK